MGERTVRRIFDHAGATETPAGATHRSARSMGKAMGIAHTNADAIRSCNTAPLRPSPAQLRRDLPAGNPAAIAEGSQEMLSPRITARIPHSRATIA